MTPVVIVGGGLAGLAAGVELARRTIPALILESRPFPGGRTYSFRHRASGDTLDNGQHLLIAGYRHTLEYLERIGTRHLISVRPPGSLFHHPERGFVRLSLPGLPPPLGLLTGILTTPLLGFGDRIRVLRAGTDLLARRQSSSLSVSEWLDRTGQTAEARRSFWDPLSVAIMNEDPARASAAAFRAALRGAFLDQPGGAAPAVPAVGLSELLVDPAVRTIERAGGAVRCGAPVESLLRERDGRVRGVRLRDGSELGARAVILAVPPGPPGPDGRRWTYSPIITVYLWLRGHPVGDEMVGFVGRTVQWVFDRTTIAGRDPSRGQLCAAVISAARSLEAVPGRAIARTVSDEIGRAYGTSLDVLDALVIRERRATVSLTPGQEKHRPEVGTAVPNLLRAGDWIATGLPATIEGAIASGTEAGARAAAVLG